MPQLVKISCFFAALCLCLIILRILSLVPYSKLNAKPSPLFRSVFVYSFYFFLALVMLINFFMVPSYFKQFQRHTVKYSEMNKALYKGEAIVSKIREFYLIWMERHKNLLLIIPKDSLFLLDPFFLDGWDIHYEQKDYPYHLTTAQVQFLKHYEFYSCFNRSGPPKFSPLYIHLFDPISLTDSQREYYVMQAENLELYVIPESLFQKINQVGQ